MAPLNLHWYGTGYFEPGFSTTTWCLSGYSGPAEDFHAPYCPAVSSRGSLATSCKHCAQGMKRQLQVELAQSLCTNFHAASSQNSPCSVAIKAMEKLLREDSSLQAGDQPALLAHCTASNDSQLLAHLTQASPINNTRQNYKKKYAQGQNGHRENPWHIFHAPFERFTFHNQYFVMRYAEKC